MNDIRAISIRAPWAWLIVHGSKRIENRKQGFPSAFRGELLLHASVKRSQADRDAAIAFVESFDPDLAARIPLLEDLPRGGIVARCRLADVIHPVGAKRRGDAPYSHPLGRNVWYTGGVGLVLSDVRETPRVPCKGALGLWRPPADVIETLGAKP